MSLLNFFKTKEKTASLAKERLQLILSHERNGNNASRHDFLPQLQRELLEVIAKYIKIDGDDVKVNMERLTNVDVLEVKIEIPEA